MNGCAREREKGRVRWEGEGEGKEGRKERRGQLKQLEGERREGGGCERRWERTLENDIDGVSVLVDD